MKTTELLNYSTVNSFLIFTENCVWYINLHRSCARIASIVIRLENFMLANTNNIESKNSQASIKILHFLNNSLLVALVPGP
jgi:hypothetical protein